MVVARMDFRARQGRRGKRLRAQRAGRRDGAREPGSGRSINLREQRRMADGVKHFVRDGGEMAPVVPLADLGNDCTEGCEPGLILIGQKPAEDAQALEPDAEIVKVGLAGFRPLGDLAAQLGDGAAQLHHSLPVGRGRRRGGARRREGRGKLTCVIGQIAAQPAAVSMECFVKPRGGARAQLADAAKQPRQGRGG